MNKFIIYFFIVTVIFVNVLSFSSKVYPKTIVWNAEWGEEDKDTEEDYWDYDDESIDGEQDIGDIEEEEPDSEE